MVSNKDTNKDRQIVSFVKFLQMGELGPLRLGLSVDDVYNLLGAPLRTKSPGEGTDIDHLLTFCYKNLSITFIDDQLTDYIIQYRNVRMVARGGLPPKLHIPWFYRIRKMTLTDFVDLVKTHHLRAKKLVGQVNESGESLFFPDDGGKTFYFLDSSIEVFFNLNISNTIYQITCFTGELRNLIFVDVE